MLTHAHLPYSVMRMDEEKQKSIHCAHPLSKPSIQAHLRLLDTHIKLLHTRQTSMFARPSSSNIGMNCSLQVATYIDANSPLKLLLVKTDLFISKWIQSPRAGTSGNPGGILLQPASWAKGGWLSSYGSAANVNALLQEFRLRRCQATQNRTGTIDGL